MKFPALVFTVAATLTLAACSDGGSGTSSPSNSSNSSTSTSTSSSVDDQGNCGPAFIADYNTIVAESKTVKNMADRYNPDKYSILNVLRTLKNSCTKFTNTHIISSCRALENGSSKNIFVSDVKEKCKKVDESITKIESLDKPASPSIPRNDSESDLRSIQRGDVRFSITSKINFLRLKNNDLLMSVNGHLIDSSEALLKIAQGEVACFIEADSSFDDRDTNDLMLSQPIGNVETKLKTTTITVSIANEDGTMAIGCVKSGSSAFTLREVKNALENTIRLQ